MMSTDKLHEVLAALNTISDDGTGANRSFDALHRVLSKRINLMINDDFHGLVQLLYSMDIAEDKLKLLLQNNPGENAGEMMATLIIKRQLEKIETRKAFTSHRPIDENDRW